ncbi:enolase-phosphatase E1-like [Onthophagus taurus]|uniref:enolase-phosphatase E1-like n=1 Tax=Onthophagus taurus TaxID=166361 RepID=UPI0039BDB5F5
MIPPERWKLIVTVIAFCVVEISSNEREGKLLDDGWKPIIGHGRIRESHFSKENPFRVEENLKIKESFNRLKEEQEPTEITPKLSSSTPHSSHPNGQYHLSKVPSSHGKHHQLHYLTNQFIQPKPVLTHRSQNKIVKYPVLGKTHVSSSKRTKPQRGPQGAYSQRDEVIAAAPSNTLNNYAYYTHNNPSRLNQHSSLEYQNHFGNDLYHFQRLPVQQYVLPKQPTNEGYTFQAQNDEYTRNLVPPPPSKEFLEQEKQQKTKVFGAKQKETITEAPKVTKSQSSNEIILQIPSPYQQQQNLHNQFYLVNQNEQAIDVQVTKENVKEIHNSIPIGFQNYQFIQKPSSQSPNLATYEVTESKNWLDTPSYDQFQLQHQQVLNNERRKPIKQEIFLPTPLKPIPTLPTQNEVSTIFTELSQKVKQKPDSFFNVKEVSTHYPILGKPIMNHFEFSLSSNDQENEITTTPKPRGNKYRIEEPEITTEPFTTTTTTSAPSTETQEYQIKRRPHPNRRRKPIRTQAKENEDEEVQIRPIRRRPVQRVNYNNNNQQIIINQNESNSQTNEKNEKRVRYRQRYRPPVNQEITIEEQFTKPTEGAQRKPTLANKEEIKITEDNSREETMEMTEQQIYTSEEVTKNDENDFTVENNKQEDESNEEKHEPKDEITIQEIYHYQAEKEETTLATTTTTTTTTTTSTTTTPEPPTLKPKLRRRPIQYNPIRPSFSLKDNKNRFLSTTTTTTTETPKPTETSRTRLLYRTRRPYLTKPVEIKEETLPPVQEITEPAVQRKKFIPKDPRHGTNDEEIRKRPLGRFRSTTQAPPQQKVSIKPNIFNNLRRPIHSSLRERIQNRTKIEKTTLPPEEITEIEDVTDIITEQNQMNETPKIPSTTTTTTTTTPIPDVTRGNDERKESEGDEYEESEDVEMDIMKNDAFLQSQRVSDLTSSAQNDYNVPGIFKSVNSNVRRVPSYFTLSTEDPILPIEAFFTNINKDRH